ncbi:hypothetical protein ACOBR2_02705 [Telmatobacter bradus]|uniref:hypothetical protein n=1 Tax=Telmatobacter bradus TaxID=474953 RepID=UPI003B42EC26
MARIHEAAAAAPLPVAPLPAAPLVATIEEYLAAHPEAAVLEEGKVAFDMRSAHCTVAEQHGRCVVQFWNDERNLLRTVVEVQQRAHSLRLITHRMGASRSQTLELVPSHERRTPTTRESARRHYQRLLERVLSRRFVGAKVDGFRSAMDLEHSFGPAYVRGRLLQGTAADAVIGVSAAESGAIIDGVLTLGILWLDYCRQKTAARRHYGGLKVIVPEGAARTTAERMAWLNYTAANFQLFTLNEQSEELEPVEHADMGNATARLMHACSPESVLARCREGLDRLLELVPDGARCRIEVRPRTATEVGLLLHGLEFARVRQVARSDSFDRVLEVSFGAGPNETLLDESNTERCRELIHRLFLSRYPDGAHNDPLFRLQPERWLESEVRAGLSELLPALRCDLFYEQVPAVGIGDRGLLDLLTLDRSGRLVVIELKADEDLHLPLQALDYWIRVRTLNADRKTVGGAGRQLSAFERAGYFTGNEVSELDPRLLLAAPALRIHPANETVLRYLSPRVDWELIAFGEHWRSELKIVFRKRSTDQRS